MYIKLNNATIGAVVDLGTVIYVTSNIEAHFYILFIGFLKVWFECGIWGTVGTSNVHELPALD